MQPNSRPPIRHQKERHTRDFQLGGSRRRLTKRGSDDSAPCSLTRPPLGRLGGPCSVPRQGLALDAQLAQPPARPSGWRCQPPLPITALRPDRTHQRRLTNWMSACVRDRHSLLLFSVFFAYRRRALPTLPDRRPPLKSTDKSSPLDTPMPTRFDLRDQISRIRLHSRASASIPHSPRPRRQDDG